MNADEEKPIKDKVVIEYTDAKINFVALHEKAFQIGADLSGLAALLKSEKDVTNIDLESCKHLLSDQTYETIARLMTDIASAESEMTRLTERMRQINYGKLL